MTRRIAALALVPYALHFAWEMGQAPLFATMRELPFWKGTAWCMRAAMWDVLISAVAYVAAALAALSVRWVQHPRMLHLAVYFGAGLAITVAIERWAVAGGRWRYAPAMPTLFGIGLSPLLQWLIVPLLIAATVRVVIRSLRSR